MTWTGGRRPTFEYGPSEKTDMRLYASGLRVVASDRAKYRRSQTHTNQISLYLINGDVLAFANQLLWAD